MFLKDSLGTCQRHFFSKIQHLFMTKVFQRAELEGKKLAELKTSGYEKPTAITINRET